MLIHNPSSSLSAILDKNASNVTATTENNEPNAPLPPLSSELNSAAATVTMEKIGEIVVKKKRGRKPGSISKKKLIAGGKKLGKKRGRKPKHIKEKLMRQAALQKLKE